MKCVVQRVREASVSVDGKIVGEIGVGLMALVGITHSDTAAQAEWMAEKLVTLRVFPDDDGKMNRSVLEVGGGLLVVSQFTLYGTLKKGTRPSFVEAASPTLAEPLFNHLVQSVKSKAPNLTVGTGVFGAMMDVALINDGPVTIVVER